MLQLALLADDLTGALDAAGPFALRGLSVVVATGPAAIRDALRQGADVVAVSLNCREGSAARAVAETEQAAAQLSADGVAIFKKVDSRLKGHVGAELSALMRVLGRETAILCPAIPELGRIVIKGAIQGHGVADPIKVQTIVPPGLAVSTPDAASDRDLDAILALAPPGTVLVGARGLAAALARRMVTKAPARPTTVLPVPIAMAIGSRDPITLAQVVALRAACPAAVWTGAPNGRTPDEVATASLTILQACPGETPVSSSEVTAAFAQAAARLAGHHATLVLTGGETAASVLALLGIELLRLSGEVLPGIPICHPIGAWSALTLVTKSGGFGERDALLRLVADAEKGKAA